MTDKLDKITISNFLDPSIYSYQPSIEILDTIPSTNTYLLTNPSLLPGQVCFAERQTAARGQYQRRWLSGNNTNLCFSLCWQFPPHIPLSALSLAVGVMLIQGLLKFNITDLQLKWPNDVLAQGRKLAGILIESASQAGQPQKIIIGVGVNVALSSEDKQAINQPIIDIHSLLSEPISRNQLAGVLLHNLFSQLPHFQQAGFEAFLADWHQFDILKNRAVTVDSTLSGTCLGVDRYGALLVKTADKVHSFVNASVKLA